MMKFRIAALAAVASLTASLVLADESRGLNTEYKNPYVPTEQQSGWRLKEDADEALPAFKPAFQNVSRGLNTEYKNPFIPAEHQSGWGHRVEAAAPKGEKYSPLTDYVEPEAPKPVEPAKPKKALVVPTEDWTLRGVQFETGSDQLTKSSYAPLDEAAEILRTHERVEVEIQGHTDNVGGNDDNQRLSEKRALAVKRYLVSKGVHGDRLQPRGYGEAVPVADNGTEQGRSQNRRITFKVISR